MIGRFVVLEHRDGTTPDHWDWMFDLDGRSPLATFTSKLDAIPGAVDEFTSEEALEVWATLRPDHRRCYLDFRGELSDQRGKVLSCSSGLFRLVERSATEIQFEILSSRGRIEFAKGQRLIIHFEPQD